MSKRTIDWVTNVITGTDGVATALLTFAIPSGASCSILAEVQGRNTATGETIAATRRATLKNVAGVVSLVGTVQNIVTLADTALSSASVAIDISGTSARVVVTGLAATTIEWFGDMRVRVH